MVDLRIRPKSVYSVAKKEFADNLRNKWIILLIVIFVMLTLASSYLAGGQTGGEGLGGMEETVVALLAISSLLIPLIAIMLGYATISGEAESGALTVVLAYPVRRSEVLLGKFLGLGSVIAVTVFVGFGVGGVIIAASVGGGTWMNYLVFIVITILLGLIYLSLSMFFSTIAKKRSTSLGFAVLIFFWGMIYGMIVFGIYLGGGGDFARLMTGQEAFPEWIWWSMFLSPMDMSQMASM
ncbi:MAG: ABC transporter permease subunit, partial [Thermoplasmata archaeon]|nr:ABC transporter permease subunit [Thermoplasmata archaeon]